MKWHGAWLYGVHRTRRDGSSFLWHQPRQRCKYTTSVDIQKTRYKKLFTHVESHASAVCLLESGEKRYIKVINNNNSFCGRKSNIEIELEHVVSFCGRKRNIELERVVSICGRKRNTELEHVFCFLVWYGTEFVSVVMIRCRLPSIAYAAISGTWARRTEFAWDQYYNTTPPRRPATTTHLPYQHYSC